MAWKLASLLPILFKLISIIDRGPGIPEDQMDKIKKALDTSSLLNPGKVYPILRKCAEEGRVHVHKGKTKFPNIPRF